MWGEIVKKERVGMEEREERSDEGGKETETEIERKID